MKENIESFFQEIEEDVRLEKLEKLWKRYQKPILGGAIAFVMIVSGGLYWNHSYKTNRESISQTYSDALAKLQKDEKEEGFAMLDSIKEDKGYGALAMLMKAAFLEKNNETLPQALEIYNQIVTSKSYDKKFTMLAGLLRAYNELDAGDTDKVRENLEVLKDVNNPWQVLAIELEATLEDKLGNKDKAKELYKQLADDARASQTMRARALAILTDYK